MTTPSKGQPSVEDLLVNVYSMSGKLLGSEGVKGIKQAKSRLLAHALSCLPEREPEIVLAGKTARYMFVKGHNAAIDLMEQKLREGYE